MRIGKCEAILELKLQLHLLIAYTFLILHTYALYMASIYETNSIKTPQMDKKATYMSLPSKENAKLFKN